jgi:hypothetical protein
MVKGVNFRKFGGGDHTQSDSGGANRRLGYGSIDNVVSSRVYSLETGV